MKKISLITPCFNAEKYIEETIRSVLHQTALINDTLALEYIFCDGGSTDNTVKIIEKTIGNNNAPNCSFQVCSEKDQGMYDALSKGLKKVSGDYCAYINAGDFYAPYAFDVIHDAFENETVKWITSTRVLYNEKSQIVSMRTPIRYRRRLISGGIYGLALPHIQQESTFWKSELNAFIDHSIIATFKLAGDYYLWHQFAAKADLYIVESHLAGFKIHKGQQSENHALYLKEIARFVPHRYLNIILYSPVILYDLLYYIPDLMKSRINRKTLITFDHSKGKWKLPQNS